MTKRNVYLGGALATALILAGGCASADHSADQASGDKDASTISVTTHDDGSFTIQSTPGAENGFSIPEQVVTPTFKPPPKKGDGTEGEGPAQEEPQAGPDSSLRVEKYGEDGAFVISKEPGEGGGFRIPPQVVVPTFSPDDDPHPQAHTTIDHEP
ncbi:MAG: hypothetical protein H6858_06275 [Rhodospirillales bacterium]|nr:hypothetical protein [Alphaproteobacteria bacterium]MCB1838684.1 hypothetical protein [Alphaproteobacteria bacterium]MCB9977184.1 hypothetical protein [Rhodospirillales bacterium]